MNNLFAERFSELLQQHLWSYEELAKKLGLKSKGTICKYAKGNIKNVNTSMVVKIANLYNVSPTWLIGLANDKTPSFKKNELYTFIPAIDSNGNSISNGIIALEKSESNNKYTAFKCEDTSMSPIINPCDLLLVELDCNPKNGDLCLISKSNNFMIRKFFKHSNKIILDSINPNFESLTYSSIQNALDNIDIIGIVRKLERTNF